MTLLDYIGELGGQVVRVVGGANPPVVSATGDSRQVTAGSLFVAIPGEHVDGLDFLPEAVARGAAAAVAESCPEGWRGEIPLVVVRDARLAAALIAEIAAGRPAAGMRMLGITGTNGKTTCAYLLRDVLRAAGRRVGMIGTVEYDLGDGEPLAAERTTPMPFDLQRILKAMAGRGCSDAVAEVSSHALHQMRFGTTRFAGALFTNLTGDHLDYHRTEEAYFAAKSRLFTECLRTDGAAVVNVDDPWGGKLHGMLGGPAARRAVTGFGFAAGADFRIADFSFGLAGLEFRLERGAGGSLPLRSPLLGRFNASNIAAVATLACRLGVPDRIVAGAVARFAGAPGRMQAVAGPGGSRIVVDYAHTDDALNNVLATLGEIGASRLTVVFGCGGDRDRGKRPRMGAVAAALADRIFVTSDNPRSEEPEKIIDDICAGIPRAACCRRVADRRQAIGEAIGSAVPGEVVLIAGKGHEDYQEIKGRKFPFSDLDEVQAALGGLPAG